jgi:tungstate transport system ATP-binding protein
VSTSIHYQTVRKIVHGKQLFNIESLQIHENSCVALSGRNGVGKSTLLRIMAGLEAPDSSTVTINNQTLSWKRARKHLLNRVIYLHQQPYLFDRSVTDNIAYGLRQRHLSIQEISGKVSEAMEWAGIAHLQMRNARELSGGERQCVAFARARILSPRLLLLDEPMANMDSEARKQTHNMIKLLKDDGVSIVLATHEYHTVAHLCETQLCLEEGVLRCEPVVAAGDSRKIIPYG